MLGMALGLPNDQLARYLCLQPHSVENYVSELGQALGTTNHGQLASVCAAMIDEWLEGGPS
jgi:DNA-binding NarL/FixJ family response regulator